MEIEAETLKVIKRNKKLNYAIAESEDGSLVVYNPKTGIGWEIPWQEVSFRRLFDEHWLPTPIKTVDGKPIHCRKCKKPTVFEVGRRKVRNELVLIYYGCTSCGHVEKEPID